jgi:sterol desaturase/sphingolipid hydroxylase (fatty acid hydroxylase superfamily)
MLMHGAMIGLGLFLLLFLLERFFPLRQPRQSLIQRLVVNGCITALAFAVNAVLIMPISLFIIHWTEQRSLGIMHLVQLPKIIEGAIAFLLLDVTFYYWHRANHRFSILWRFHNVHHIDPDLDVSTAARFHVGEMILSIGFRALQVGLIGATAPVYLLYEVIYQTNILFHHSNVRLPLPLEQWLNLVVVTPRMHGIHHSQIQQETNSNFSVLFPWWDRFFQTLRLDVPQSDIAIGVPAYTQPNDNRLRQVLLMPFQPQRDYWGSLEQTVVKNQKSTLSPN